MHSILPKFQMWVRCGVGAMEAKGNLVWVLAFVWFPLPIQYLALRSQVMVKIGLQWFLEEASVQKDRHIKFLEIM